jgi:5-formyltetrahydrofolate cyclo-ligase
MKCGAMNDNLAARNRAAPRVAATRRARGAFKVGICFSFQLLDPIPTELHDVLMDAIITDAEDES